MAELAGIVVDLGIVDIGKHVAESFMESEERFINVSRSRVPVLEGGFHGVRETGESLGKRGQGCVDSASMKHDILERIVRVSWSSS